MVNVYDLVANFYENDDGWNAVLRREYAEGFLRKEAWSGVEDDELQDEWEYILMLCLYLGHAEIYLGDMSEDEIVDAVAWCGRNVTDFEISYDSVKEFLDVIGGLFVYLKEKHAISSSLAPHMAKNQLLKEDGTLALINSEGDFLPGEDKRLEYAAADVPTKIFLNMGDALAELLEELHDYFQKESFNLDLERAVFFYHGFFSTDKMEVEPETEEFWQCFWDYFLFDYHLISDDKTPLQHFAANGKSKNIELVNELCKSRLAIFTVEEACDEGVYSCKDFLTEEEYSLNLPLDVDSDIKDMDKTGAGKIIADTVLGWLGSSATPYTLFVAITVLATIQTQVMSCTGTAAILTPIALFMAKSMGIDPHAIVVGIIMGSNLAMMTPIGSVPSSMAAGTGKYSFMDFVKLGTPLTIILLILTILVTPIFFPM